MSEKTVITGVLIEDTTTFSFIEVCTRYHIPKKLLHEMIEQGLFDVQSTNEQQLTLTQKDLQKMESAFRLHKDLGVNLEGVALALELLDELERLRTELKILRRHF